MTIHNINVVKSNSTFCSRILSEGSGDDKVLPFLWPRKV